MKELSRQGRVSSVTFVLLLVLALFAAAVPTMARAADIVPTVEVQAYQGGVGWRAADSSGATSGGDGSGRPLEMLKATLRTPGVPAGISLSVYQGGVWSDPVDSGRVVGYAGTPIQAVRMHLTGEAANAYDLAYRTSCVGRGWFAWTGGDAISGAPDVAAVEAVQVALVPKGGVVPTSEGPAFVSAPKLSFSGYVSGKGWDGPRSSGNGVGEGGRALHSFTASLSSLDGNPGSVRYRVLVANRGWLEWVADGAEACPIDPEAPIQAIQIELDGVASEGYEVWYHTYVPYFGWMGCTKDGGTAGTTGLGLNVEAVQAWLLPKGSAAPASTDRPTVDVSEVSKIGWQNPAGYYQVSSRNVLPRPGAYPPFNYVTPSRIAVNATREDCIAAFVQRAREYVGSPYVWNYSCAPGVGVDCIGLVYQCAYATGMDLGEFNPWDHWATGANGWHSHDAVNMWNYGKIQRLPIGYREFGDLIFFPGHVGIYVGNDMMINAWSPGVGVIYSSIWSLSPLGVGRLYVR